MQWQVSYLDDERVIELLFQGQLTRSDISDSIVATIAAGRAHGTKNVLCDATALSGGHTVFDLYGLADSLHALGLPAGSREAIIVPLEGARAAEANFWENACANRGFEVRCFVDRERALAWLRASELPLTGT